MKATFDVTVKINGRNVEVSLAMRDGAEDIDAKTIEKLLNQVQHLSRKMHHISQKTAKSRVSWS